MAPDILLNFLPNTEVRQYQYSTKLPANLPEKSGNVALIWSRINNVDFWTLLQAHKNGADGVEFDLHITKDNIGILIHDESVDRTTDGVGLVSELTFEEIRKFDASVKSIYL